MGRRHHTNRAEPFGDAVAIWLEMKDRDTVCWIDASDYDLVKDYHWFVFKSRDGKTFYARGRASGSDRQVFMHALIMGKGADHKERGDGLNNRRENLRPATHAENSRNKGVQANSTTGFKGVCQRYGKFYARIKAGGKRRYFGPFDTAIEAARAYNVAAVKFFGNFASLNDVGDYDLILNQG
jgi:hypothetical protein